MQLHLFFVLLPTTQQIQFIAVIKIDLLFASLCVLACRRARLCQWQPYDNTMNAGALALSEAAGEERGGGRRCW